MSTLPMATRQAPPWTADKLPQGDELPRHEHELSLDRAELGKWLDATMEHHAGHEGIVRLSLPAPLNDPEVLLAALPEEDALFWHPPDGPAVAGVGSALRLQLSGEDRFEQLQELAEGHWSSLVSEAHPACHPAAARFYGGFAFAPGAAAADPWQDFGDGAFVLPRWAYRRQAEVAELSLAVRGSELRDTVQRRAWLATWQQLHSRLADRQPVIATMPTVLEIERPSKERFTEQVEAIRAVIASGEFAKIVAARGSRVVLQDPLQVDAVLRRLSRARSVTRFAFRRPGGTFLGATPERLVSRRGPVLSTEALAGSIAPGGEQAELLLNSGKDQQEHQLVVDAIVRCLEPLCETLDVASAPRIRELRDVLHLHTPVTGLLDRPHHVLELVSRLHPTPAVGGVPTAESLRWIAEHEPEPRGWYAAPIGWFDAAGDGDFAVALRSCVVREREAFLYAGAGIVRDSDPALEYTETELKKLALLTALGA